MEDMVYKNRLLTDGLIILPGPIPIPLGPMPPGPPIGPPIGPPGPPKGPPIGPAEPIGPPGPIGPRRPIGPGPIGPDPIGSRVHDLLLSGSSGLDIEDPEANEEKCDRFAAVKLGLRVSEDGARNLSACLLKCVYVSWEPEAKVFNPLIGSIGLSILGTGGPLVQAIIHLGWPLPQEIDPFSKVVKPRPALSRSESLSLII